jgi:hypothetical protein
VLGLRIPLIFVLALAGAKRGEAASIVLDRQNPRGELRVEITLLTEPVRWTSLSVPGEVSVELAGQEELQEFVPAEVSFRVAPVVAELDVGGLALELRIAELEWSFRFARQGDAFLSEATGASATTRFFVDGMERDLDFALPPTLPLCLGTSCLAVVGLDHARSGLHRFSASGEPGRYFLDASPAAVQPVSWEIAPLTLETLHGGVPLQVRLGFAVSDPRFARVPEPPGLASTSVLLAMLAAVRPRLYGRPRGA